MRIADRIAEAEPEKFPSAAGALYEARNQLLDQAHRGAVEIHGKPDDPEAKELSFARRDWVTVHSSFWDPIYGPTRNTFAIINFDLIWENNVFSYEEEGLAFGYSDLRVQATDVDRIWPPQKGTTVDDVPERISSPSSSTVPSQRNPGGAPRKYRDDLFVEIIRVANTPDGLPERPKLFQQLTEFGVGRWGPDACSKSTIDDVLRLVYGRLAQKP